MHTWVPHRRSTAGSRRVRPTCFRPFLESLERRDLLDAGMAGFVVTNLLSDLHGVAAHFNADLVNPWGFAETAQGQFQIAANGSGDTLHVNARGDVIPPVAVLQPPLGSPPGTTTTPNGTALNTTSDFVITDDGKSAPAEFIFSTEDGTIVAFNPMVDPKEGLLVAQSSDGAVYKLLAEASNAKGNFLFATDFHNNKIDVFDKNFDKVTLGQNGWGTFTDPHEPAGYAPFGIKLINVNGQDRLFVTYAKQDVPGAGHDDVAGLGNGFIDEFDTTGHFIQRFATGSAVKGGDAPLNSPIGMTIAPAGFGPNGKFGGALLVGNFGDSHVSAFNLQTGQFLGQLSDAQGNPLTLNGGVGAAGSKGLWGIAFGNGQGGTDPNALYFASGINNEADGLFGKVTLNDGDHDHEDNQGQDQDTMSRSSQDQSMMMSNSAGASQQNAGIANLFANNPALQTFLQNVMAEIQQIESTIAARLAAIEQMVMNAQTMSPMGASSMMMADRVFSGMGNGMMG
ncbi:MAG TPA: TIGR03118 family protein [Gemmataceae bacterium]|jgi:uncharacterized protein (TIGR03118 family)